MSTTLDSRAVIPAQLGFLAIYNPSLGTTDDTVDQQIVYYSSSSGAQRTPGSRTNDKSSPAATAAAIQQAIRDQNNEQLRQIGLAQGMVEFGRSFSDGRSVDTIETAKSRIILHELEAGWWILASIDLTVLPGPPKPILNKGKSMEEDSTEYSSREVKPAILLLGDLLKAHATFLLHHASSLSALFVRTRRPKFLGILTRYWDTYLSTWNVLMHGNPANSLYGGIKIAACGELGVGVGEEDRGSGEREVLEGFVGRIEGLVDVIVSKFGDGEPSSEITNNAGTRHATPTEPWLGSGNEPAAEDGVVFLGTGALSRKSLRDVSHWVEDLYRWGPHAYGVVDNPTSNRRTKKSKARAARTLSPEAKQNSRQVYGISGRDKPTQPPPLVNVAPAPMDDEDRKSQKSQKSHRTTKLRRPAFRRGEGSFGSTDSESGKTSTFMNYLKLGYGKHWSLSSTSSKDESVGTSEPGPMSQQETTRPKLDRNDGSVESAMYPGDDSVGHYLIGLLGDIDNEGGEVETDSTTRPSLEHRSSSSGDNMRLLLRTLTVELEREEDARAEADISIDLGSNDTDRASSKHTGSEHTATSNNSFESQDRNKTKKLRVLVYVKKPFIFVLVFELRAHILAVESLYRSLHHQIGPLIKPLLTSTSFRPSKPELLSTGSTDDTDTPVYDLMWDPKLLTINSTIPNIPSPHQTHAQTSQPPWSRLEAMNTHMQIINTYISTTTDQGETERTCKTSRGWWVVWTKLPPVEPLPTSLSSGKVHIPQPIAEDSTVLPSPSPKVGTSRGSSTVGMSMNSGPAHPFMDSPSNADEYANLGKEVFLIRRASDHAAAKRGFSGRSPLGGDGNGPGKLAHGIGIDTRRYIEGLLQLNR